MLFHLVIGKQYIPHIPVMEYGVQFKFRFWIQVSFSMRIQNSALTAHCPQTDGQTTQWTQINYQYIQNCCNYLEGNRIEVLSPAEYTYNNSVYAYTRMTQFWAKNCQNPEWQFKVPNVVYLKSDTQATTALEGLAEAQQTLCKLALEA